MKKIYAILFFIAVSLPTITAQNKDTKPADKHFDRLEYTDAIDDYEKLIKRGKADAYVYERLATAYYNLNDTENAAKYYKRVVDQKGVDSESVYNYAQSLRAQGKFTEASNAMKQFANMKPRDTRAVKYMKNPNYMPALLDNSPKYTVVNAGDINSEYSEFGGSMSGNTFYFSSARNKSRRSYGWNDQPYLDIYSATKTDEVIGSAELIPGDVNTKYHEGTVAFSADGKRMYFDRNNYFKGKYAKDEDGVNQLSLYTAEWINGKWADVTPVPFNDKNYSTGHPSLSKDGKTLYFVSDRPGGVGSSDIYKVSVDANGNFGSPENMSTVNTEGKEVFPFVADSGALFFSSDGHLGLGGLDVFKYTDGRVSNLAMPINSSSDDFAFTMNESTMTGFVSSDRQGGKGSDDIYMVNEIPSCDIEIVATVIDTATGDAIAGAQVDMYDAQRNKLGTKMSNGSGQVVFMGVCDETYGLTAQKDGYESGTASASSPTAGPVAVTIGLNPIEEIIVEDRVVLNPIFFDLDKSNIKPQAAFELDKLVQVMKKYPTMVVRIESHTDNRAGDRYNMNLSERRAKSTMQYVISKGIDASRLSAVGKGESELLVDCGGSCSEAQHQKNRRSDFIIEQR